MNSLKIGMLGGIGPQTTGYFYLSLINKLRKSGKITKNSDYPQIIINSINAIELTSEKISESMLEPYIQGVRELLTHNPDFIVMICNTIHLYRDEIIKKNNFKNILSIRDIVKNKLIGLNSNICILATPLTVKLGLYRYNECSYKNPDIDDLIIIGNIVNNYNSTGEEYENRAKLINIINKQKKRGADLFLTACTEVSELLRDEEKNIKIISTLDILLDYVFQKSITKIR